MKAAGIDVCKAHLDLAMDGSPGVVRFTNNGAGIAKLVKRLQALGALRIVVEATGGYEEPLLEACCDAGLWIARVNPRQARAFANATGELAKTDDIDARILALLPELGHLDRRQIAKLTGVAPMNRDSGQGQGKRRIRGGRAPVRVALYMATLSAVRWDPTMKAHYQQLRTRGNLGKVALVACMRKLLGIINARRRDELRTEASALA